MPPESDFNLGSSGATGSTNVLDPTGVESPLDPRSDSITRHYATSHNRKRNRMQPVIESGFPASTAGKRYSTKVMHKKGNTFS